MSDTDLRQLTMATADHALDRLEQDVWRGIRRERDDQAVRLGGAVQSFVLAAALICSIGVGAGLAFAASAGARGSGLMPGLRPAPSSLLLGVGR